MLQALVPTRLSVMGATRIASPGVASAGDRRQLSLISGLPVQLCFGIGLNPMPHSFLWWKLLSFGQESTATAPLRGRSTGLKP